MKIAYFTPLSPIQSGISEYSEKELLPYLSKYCNIDIIIDKNYEPSNNSIKENFKIISYEKFENKYDLLLYHIGNNPYHGYVFQEALKNPGVVVLHDPFLHHLIRKITVGDGDHAGYIKMMEYCLGPEGKEIAKNAILTKNFPLFEYPLVRKLADFSKTIIVHSNFAKQTVLKECPGAFVKKINMPISISESRNDNKLRRELDIPDDHIVIGTFGHVGFYKRLHILLKSFAQYNKKNPNSVFLIAGSFLNKNYANQIHELIKSLGIEDKVIEVGYVKDLLPYIQISDIAVQLRYPTAGETSIITLQILGLGKPVLVSNVGSFSELPNDSVIKIDINSKEEESIFNAFMKLASDKDYYQKLITNARKYVSEEHDPKKIGYEFIEFLSHVTNNERKNFIKNISTQLQDIGINENDSTYLDSFTENLHDIISTPIVDDSHKVVSPIEETKLENMNSVKHGLKDDDILYFLHIPKTAGTTLISIIDSYFDRKKVLGIHAWKYLLPKMPFHFKKYRFVRGHFGYGFYRIVPKKMIYMTVLRDPTDIIISSYKMNQRQPAEAKRYSIPQDKTISELITDPEIRGLRNTQTHYIGVDLDVLSLSKGMSLEELADYQPEDHDYFQSPNISDERLLEMAKNNLSKFAFVGLVEKMDESLFLLHYTFGWKPIRDTVKKNVAPDSESIILSDKAKSKIAAWTKLDNKLYSYGKQLFESRYSQMVNALKSKYYEPRFSVMSPNDVVYEMLKKHHKEHFEEAEQVKQPTLKKLKIFFKNRLGSIF